MPPSFSALQEATLELAGDKPWQVSRWSSRSYSPQRSCVKLKEQRPRRHRCGMPDLCIFCAKMAEWRMLKCVRISSRVLNPENLGGWRSMQWGKGQNISPECSVSRICAKSLSLRVKHFNSASQFGKGQIYGRISRWWMDATWRSRSCSFLNGFLWEHRGI